VLCTVENFNDPLSGKAKSSLHCSDIAILRVPISCEDGHELGISERPKGSTQFKESPALGPLCAPMARFMTAGQIVEAQDPGSDPPLTAKQADCPKVEIPPLIIGRGRRPLHREPRAFVAVIMMAHPDLILVRALKGILILAVWVVRPPTPHFDE
jgi:hypothetical protein